MADPSEKGNRFQDFLFRRKRAGHDAADDLSEEIGESEVDDEFVEEKVDRVLTEDEEDILEQKEGPLPRLTRQIPLVMGGWPETGAVAKLKDEEGVEVDLELGEQEGIEAALVGICHEQAVDAEDRGEQQRHPQDPGRQVAVHGAAIQGEVEDDERGDCEQRHAGDGLERAQLDEQLLAQQRADRP
ncbi:MAG: hypothetical protein ABSB57_01965, partial [Dehalococcoidia bacterium]